MSTAQLVVLAWFDAKRARALKHRGRWVWTSQIRKDPKLAEEFIREVIER
jgi:hypothetical protein